MTLIQLQSFGLIHLNSFKIITIYSKFIQITRIVFHFSERFILKVKTVKTKIIFTFSNMQTFLVSSFICINSLYSEKKKLRFTIIRIWENNTSKKAFAENLLK